MNVSCLLQQLHEERKIHRVLFVSEDKWNVHPVVVVHVQVDKTVCMGSVHRHQNYLLLRFEKVLNYSKLVFLNM